MYQYTYTLLGKPSEPDRQPYILNINIVDATRNTVEWHTINQKSLVRAVPGLSDDDEGYRPFGRGLGDRVLIELLPTFVKCHIVPCETHTVLWKIKNAHLLCMRLTCKEKFGEKDQGI